MLQYEYSACALTLRHQRALGTLANKIHIYIHLIVPCVLHALQVPLEVMTGATLKPKHGVFVKFEPRTWS